MPIWVAEPRSVARPCRELFGESAVLDTGVVCETNVVAIPATVKHSPPFDIAFPFNTPLLGAFVPGIGSFLPTSKVVRHSFPHFLATRKAIITLIWCQLMTWLVLLSDLPPET